MKLITRISRIVAGLIFIFSGIVKGIDPMGSMIKFTDYFTAFGIPANEITAYILGIILCTAEFIIGFAILTGIRIKEASWGLLLFMAGFTPLTLILALTNPVSDCGCFGDAIHLSNWQTFYKNLLILLFVIIVFINRNKYYQKKDKAHEWITVAAFSLLFILFSEYNHRHLPVVDFRPFRTGSDILKSMEYPADAEVDEYETTLIYSKDGTEKEFTLENYPSDDSTWIFVDSKSRLIKEGYIPPIHDFSLITENGEDLTNFVLSDPGFSLLMISNDITEADQEEILKGIELAYTCLENNISFYLLTASPEEEVKKFNDQLTAFYVDETSLKTIVRANPGYMLIKDGVVMRKWAHRDLPDEERLISAVLESPERKIPDNGITVMIMIAVITTISIIINYILKTRNGKS